MVAEKKKALGEILIFLICDAFVLILGNILLVNLSEYELKWSIMIDPLITVLQIAVVFVPVLILKDRQLNMGFSKTKLWVQFIYGFLLFAGMLIIFKIFGNSCAGMPFKADRIMAYSVYSAFSAALTEELAYRGLLFTRIKALSGNTVAAIVVSSVLFGVSHFMVGDIEHIIMSTVTGLLLCSARAYLKNCTLISTMTAHFLYDFLMCYITI